MTLNQFRRLLKELQFKATVIKYKYNNYVLWQSPTNHYLVTERKGVELGFTLYRNGKGRSAKPFHFFYQSWDNSKLKGEGGCTDWDGFDSALDPEPTILRRLTVLGIRPNIKDLPNDHQASNPGLG